MAARSWELSKDGLTYTFHLRPGLKWTDGHRVTAADYAYAWKRVADPALASDYASAVFPIKGAEDYNKGKTKDPNSIAVKAVDDLTLQVTLTEPAAYFLSLVSTWTYFPVPRWQVEKYGKKWVEADNIVTNGPFKLQSWTHDREIVLVANPDYWGAKPMLQKIVLVLTDDPVRTGVPAYENNELDVSDVVGTANIDRLRKDPAYGKQIKKLGKSGTALLLSDATNTDSPMSKVKVRQALFLAIDHDKIAHDVLHDTFDPASTLLPAGILGRLETPPVTGGVERARQLLAEAGYPNGQGFPGLKLAWGQTEPFDLVAQALQQMWRDELKINITLQRMERKEFNAAFSAWVKQHFDSYIYYWATDFEDPYNWDNQLFESSADWYHTKWVNPQYDALVRKGAGETNLTKRKQIYTEAHKILETDLPAMPLYRLTRWQLIKPWVEGFNLPGHGGDWFWLFRNEVKILQH